MKKWVLVAAALAGLTSPASAAVITLQSKTANGPGDYTWTYQSTLGPDEGMRNGDRLIIYDFAGYIDGSIITPSANLVGTTELTSSSGVTPPGFADDPTIVNLVFTYIGPDFRNTGGPYSPFDFEGLGARSTFNNEAIDWFLTLTTKNNPDGIPGGSNTPILTLGRGTVPSPAVPEPGSWALMLGGFGVAGVALRRRRQFGGIAA